MNQFLYFVILILGMLTYSSAVYQMIHSGYSPSFFSRATWMLLGASSFFGVVFGGGSQSSKILAGSLFIGNTAMFLVSIKKGSRDFGKIEIISLVLFLVAMTALVIFRAPLISLIITLVARFIGGMPTIARAIREPKSEQVAHWYLFIAASVVTVVASPSKSFESILFPVYFIIFNSFVVLLVNRRNIEAHQ